eukprot:6146515-Amphidinium_carterae.1
MLSGRSTWLLCTEAIIAVRDAGYVLRQCCERLGLPLGGTERLVHGSDVVAKDIAAFPGLQPIGHVSHYQLIV